MTIEATSLRSTYPTWLWTLLPLYLIWGFFSQILWLIHWSLNNCYLLLSYWWTSLHKNSLRMPIFRFYYLIEIPIWFMTNLLIVRHKCARSAICCCSDRQDWEYKWSKEQKGFLSRVTEEGDEVPELRGTTPRTKASLREQGEAFGNKGELVGTRKSLQDRRRAYGNEEEPLATKRSRWEQTTSLKGGFC